MHRTLLPFLLVAVAGACSAKGTTDTTSTPDASTSDASIDAAKEAASTGCALGTIQHCGSCNNACPGKTEGNTKVVCSDNTGAGKCGITCSGEAYDIDGKSENGCEEQDPKVQDTAATAVVEGLPSGVDVDGGPPTGNPLVVEGTLLSDARVHGTDPVDRLLGRDDWYKLSVIGGGDGNLDATTACLSLQDFPKDVSVQVCISNKDEDTFDDMLGCKTVRGGPVNAVCVTPPTKTDDGVYYVRLHKVMGGHTAAKYSLTLKH